MTALNTSTTIWDPLGDITLGVYGPFDGPVQDVAHIRDSLDAENVPVGGIIGYSNDYLQAGLICFAPMEFKYVTNWLVAGGYSETIIAQRLSKFIASPLFSSSGATANVRVVYVDKVSKSIFSDQYTLQGLTLQDDNGNYLGEPLILPVYGADRIGIYIESVSAGQVACRLCCV